MAWFFARNHKKHREREENFIKNGSLLQEELITLCNGRNLPIRVFSAKEVGHMSDCTYSNLLHEDAHFRLYKGVIEEDDRAICIKKFHKVITNVGMKGIFREIVLATQMSMHTYALKLLGCCLETDMPILVYEFADKGCLADRIHNMSPDGESLPWKIRLRIGSEISYALAYQQNGFRRPIIFRNLAARDVFLDKDYVAKLTGFYFSVLIPEGQVHVDDAVVGTIGYMSPEYMSSGRLTEKTDVFNIGVLLFELLGSRSRLGGWLPLCRLLHVDQNHARDVKVEMIIDPAISKEVQENKQEYQLQLVFDLALRCMADENDRPNIVDVASELKKIYRSCELSQDTLPSM